MAFPLTPATSRDVSLKLKMNRLPPATPPCQPDALKLVWFTDAAGTFSETAEAAYLLPEGDGAAGPVLAVAGLLGETCGADVFWASQWTPASGTGGAPGLFQDGNRLVVWPKEGTVPGLLTLKATANNITYGPIALTIDRYACLNYCYCGDASTPFDIDPLTWSDGTTAITETNTWDNPGVTHTSEVTGVWPPGTTFLWAYTHDLYGFDITVAENVIYVHYNQYASGTFTAGVTATAPDGRSKTVGDITLVVYPY